MIEKYVVGSVMFVICIVMIAALSFAGGLVLMNETYIEMSEQLGHSFVEIVNEFQACVEEHGECEFSYEVSKRSE